MATVEEAVHAKILVGDEEYEVVEGYTTAVRRVREATEASDPLVELRHPGGLRAAFRPSDIMSVLEVERFSRAASVNGKSKRGRKQKEAPAAESRDQTMPSCKIEGCRRKALATRGRYARLCEPHKQERVRGMQPA